MQLKRLQLFGFKTFADKTEIEIDSGLTAVVGPNGSGKSNLVDALLWVLGEQNPRLLRGTSAQDVIFSGTDKRKPLGMAEVRLTIDNSDKALPLDFAEVTVARRVYRSGESQYLLNNAPCRLKDIVELFLDTGMGKGAYAFVSQSEIDSVLSARAEDRRELFEEAAGIKKYRVKKKEALRKLEAAEGNLNRVRDILTELEAQREPMEKQALTAKRYLLLQERLREIEVGLLVAEVQTSDYELYAARTERDADQESLLAIDAELAHFERASEGVGERLSHAENEMEASRITHQSALSALERTESQLNLLAERAQSSLRTGTQLTQDLNNLLERIAEAENLVQADTEDLAQTEAQEIIAEENWTQAKAELERLEQAVRSALRQAEDQQAERLKMAQERVRQEGALKAAKERLIVTQRRIGEVSAEITHLTHAQIENATALQDLAQETETRTLERKEREQARTQNETTRQTLLQAQASTQAALQSVQRRLTEQTARLNTLTELQENHEGFYQGVRAVLKAHSSGQLKGHLRAVVDLITVPEPLRVAIEVALGGSVQDIVTVTEQEAKRAIEWLKQNRAGRATFLPMPLLRSAAPLQSKNLTGLNGLEGIASECITYDPAYRTVLELLLGRVLIAKEMDSALSASRKIQGWSKIVTLEGELLTPSGALTGGSLQGRGVHLVGRKGEMDDLAAKLPQTREELAQESQKLEQFATQNQALEQERNRLQAEEATLLAQLAAAQSQHKALRTEQERLNRRLEELLPTQTLLTEQIASLEEEIEQREASFATGTTEDSHAEGVLAELNTETRSLAARRDEVRARTVAFEVERGRLRTLHEGLTRSLANQKATLETLQHEQAQKTSQRTMTEEQRTQTIAEREHLLRQRTTQEAALAQAETVLNQWRDQRQELLNANFELNNGIKERMQQRGEITKNLHDAELRIARLEVQSTQAAERLFNEYNITKEEALALPDNATIDRNTAMEVSRLRREIRGMGQVNTGAVGEYERLTERFEFLNTQKDDLERGREALLSTIAEIDAGTRDVFLEVFHAVGQEFDRLFKRLFEGGTTSLVLTHPDDLLETGIEVIAQPPGKKPQSLSLLSGGERALTATALLFAFLSVRPSPFVILDEVDAPLDGANVAKFAELVREFSERSQFLLITHNPTTMEATPLWYGVTMQEPGISTIIAYRVPDSATPSDTETSIVLSGN